MQWRQTSERTLKSDQGYLICHDRRGNYHCWAPGTLPAGSPGHWYACSGGRWHCFAVLRQQPDDRQAIAACRRHQDER